MLQDLIVAVIIGILTGLGVGSGGLLVIYLTLIENYPQVAAQGLNLLFFLFSASASMIVHLTKRNIFFSLALWLILSAAPGIFIGVWLTSVLGVMAIRIIFGIMLITSGIITLFRKKEAPAKAKISSYK